MSEADVQNEQDLALAKALRLRTILQVARSRAGAVADQMESVAGQPRSQPWNISLGSYSWLAPNSLTQIVVDIAKAQAELSAASDRAADLGGSLPRFKWSTHA